MLVVINNVDHSVTFNALKLCEPSARWSLGIIRKPIDGDRVTKTAAWKTVKLNKPVEQMEREGST